MATNGSNCSWKLVAFKLKNIKVEVVRPVKCERRDPFISRPGLWCGGGDITGLAPDGSEDLGR